METSAVDVGALLDACDEAVVTLVAGDTRLVVHRAVLTDRSPVFSAMFRHDTLESRSGQVSIADVEGPVLRQLVSYLYSLRAPQPSDTVGQLLAAADKYGVAGLKAACEQQVAAQLTVETAAATAVLAVRHSCQSLSKVAVDFIKANFVRVVVTKGWADAVRLQPEDMVRVSQLVAEQPAVTSVPVPAGRGTPQPATQPHSGSSRHCRTPASAEQAMAASHQIPLPDEAAVSLLRGLSAEEKGRRLREAAKQGAVEELEALLVAGAELCDKEDVTRRIALHYAALRGHVEAARRLVTWETVVSFVNLMDYFDRIPLSYAAEYGHAAVVRLLLAASADHRSRDRYRGWTPLHWAAARGHLEVAAVLLEAGADKGARDNQGKKPLDVAYTEFTKFDLLDLLT